MSDGHPAGVPRSILDTDLYKLSMQQAVLHHFPDVRAVYRFTLRDTDVYFSRTCYERFLKCLPCFKTLELTSKERAQLEKHCPYFKPAYLDHLAAYRFKPEQVHVKFIPKDDDPNLGRLDMEAHGLWSETIMWEVPLMACLSETYFLTDDTDWNYEGQAEKAADKARRMFEAGCAISEFGTRRRRSWKTQDLVFDTLKKTAEAVKEGKLTGTSNVSLAMHHDLAPVGTIAHEWFMGIAALKGYEDANGTALDLWTEVYPSSLLTALTDTFSSDVFWRDFEAVPERAKRWTGLRQDSGDPFLFAPQARQVYQRLGIDHTTKSIIYSDSLDVDKVLKLKEQCDKEGFPCGFGIGTSLTNDFRKASDPATKSRALNMVIKLGAVDGKQCIKISDDTNKVTGDKETAARVKSLYKLG